MIDGSFSRSREISWVGYLWWFTRWFQVLVEHLLRQRIGCVRQVEPHAPIHGWQQHIYYAYHINYSNVSECMRNKVEKVLRELIVYKPIMTMAQSIGMNGGGWSMMSQWTESKTMWGSPWCNQWCGQMSPSCCCQWWSIAMTSPNKQKWRKCHRSMSVTSIKFWYTPAWFRD